MANGDGTGRRVGSGGACAGRGIGALYWRDRAWRADCTNASRSLERFDFDSVLLPYSYILMQNPEYAADFDELSRVCAERKVAVQTIKGITRAPWGDDPQTTTTWYKPLVDQDSIDLAAQWVLGNEQVFLNTASDVNLLPKVIDAAERFGTRPSDVEMDGLVRSQAMEPLFV